MRDHGQSDAVQHQSLAEVLGRKHWLTVRDSITRETLVHNLRQGSARNGSDVHVEVSGSACVQFYLAPAGAMMAEGHLQADFAVRRIGFNLYRLPGTPPDFIRDDSDPMPAKDAKAEIPALKAMLQREYKGFELPASLR